ncbi:MAG TPA: anti-sigma factor [Anaerolineae bacterium]|nr:anti-sigma factor [Anaerolineae bacterium]
MTGAAGPSSPPLKRNATMKKRLLLTLIVLLTAAIVISACSRAQEPAPTPTPAAMTDDAMNKTDDMSKDDSMASDESMEKNDEVMGSDDTMKKEEGDMSSDESMEKKDDGMSSEDAMMQAALTLTFANLPNLGPDWAYEGWLIVDGKPVTTGVFTVDDHGMASAAEFPVDAHALKNATAFVLTIEPSPDDDPAPNAIHIIGGDFDGDAAALTVSHPLALGVDFDGVNVSYILGAPSSENAKADYKKGIWWPGLNLPQLPQGWVYEGWVAGPDGPISTGRFTSGDMADSDGNGPMAGPKSGPSFPGQDFINPPIDLTAGYAAVISIEPDPDNSPLPFSLKPFIDETIDDVSDHGSQDMETRTDAFPTGQAQR